MTTTPLPISFLAASTASSLVFPVNFLIIIMLSPSQLTVIQHLAPLHCMTLPQAPWAISTKYFPSHETTNVVTLDPKVEQEIMGSVKQTESGAFLNLDPNRSRAIGLLPADGPGLLMLLQCGRYLHLLGKKSPIIITSPIVRMYFRRLTEDYYRELVVVSYNEVEPNVELQSVGMVSSVTTFVVSWEGKYFVDIARFRLWRTYSVRMSVSLVVGE